ncbi:MAG: MarC family protein [Spirochaetaceae bacterium]|jgi:multiple antibiotic resistance protein|nr:MarC family protein [Spirochaetaceae bacterium]
MTHDFLQILFTVLIVIDPFGIIPSYISQTSSLDKKTRKKICLQATVIGGLVLFVFVFGGRAILSFFGIRPGAFYIAGGVLFFLIAVEMIYSKPTNRHVPNEEALVAEQQQNSKYIALFPLAIPMIAGPGMISVIMMYMTNPRPWVESLVLVSPAVLIGLIVMYITLRASDFLFKVLGEMGMFVLEKIMGLILSGFAVQLIYNGLTSLGILK